MWKHYLIVALFFMAFFWVDLARALPYRYACEPPIIQRQCDGVATALTELIEVTEGLPQFDRTWLAAKALRHRTRILGEYSSQVSCDDSRRYFFTIQDDQDALERYFVLAHAVDPTAAVSRVWEDLGWRYRSLDREMDGTYPTFILRARCESDGGYRECRVPGMQHAGAALDWLLYNETPECESRHFGLVGKDRVWVDKGCRATIRIRFWDYRLESKWPS